MQYGMDNNQSLERSAGWAIKPEIGEGMRIAQECFLDELPGAIFVFLTLMWVITTFMGLFY